MRTGQMIQLGLLPDPEDAESHKAHRLHQNTRRELHKVAPEIVFGMHRSDCGSAQVRHEPPAQTYHRLLACEAKEVLGAGLR